MLAALGERRVIGRGAVDAHHSEERVQEALGLAQRQVEDETERERGFDREVGVLELPSTRADAARRPGVDGLRCQPQGDVAPADEGAIVGGPVRNAVPSSCTLDGLATSSSQCSRRLHSLEQIERIPVFEPLRPRGIHAPTPATADAAAWARGRRPKRCRLATYPALRDAVATKLAQKWSPQQIAGWLRRAYPDDPTMRVSHETIYLSLFVQSRGVLKKALQAQLRQRRTIRRPRAAAPKTGGYIVGAVSIRERPATVEDRAVPGHWEGDLIAGARQSYVATLERTTA